MNLNIPPVSTPPPVFLSFGMPPAKRPPSCGAASMAGAAGASRLPWSLLLLALLPGTGGARPPGAFGRPGTGGAPPSGDGPGPPDTFPTTGADRSLVTVFFNALPLDISERRAPLTLRQFHTADSHEAPDSTYSSRSASRRPCREVSRGRRRWRRASTTWRGRRGRGRRRRHGS